MSAAQDRPRRSGPRRSGPRRAVAPATRDGQPIEPTDPPAAARPAEPAQADSQTRDDTDAGWGESAEDAQGTHDRWLQQQRPPHWE